VPSLLSFSVPHSLFLQSVIFSNEPDEVLTRGTVFKAVAMLRSAEAAVLQRRAQMLGAVYLAGYAVECHLKYAVCVANGQLWLPSWVTLPNRKPQRLYTHDWNILVAAAGIRAAISHEPRVEAHYASLATAWGPSLRYRAKLFEKHEGERLYSDLQSLYQFLRKTEP
jgi:hypothetical protein